MSRQKISLLSLSVVAAAALAEATFVTLRGETAAAGAAAHGVATWNAVEGEPCLVDVLGTSIVTAEAAIAKGDALEVGANGGAVPQDTGVLVAYATEAAAEGDLVEVLIVLGGSTPPADSGGA